MNDFFAGLTDAQMTFGVVGFALVSLAILGALLGFWKKPTSPAKEYHLPLPGYSSSYWDHAMRRVFKQRVLRWTREEGFSIVLRETL